MFKTDKTLLLEYPSLPISEKSLRNKQSDNSEKLRQKIKVSLKEKTGKKPQNIGSVIQDTG